MGRRIFGKVYAPPHRNLKLLLFGVWTLFLCMEMSQRICLTERRYQATPGMVCTENAPFVYCTMYLCSNHKTYMIGLEHDMNSFSRKGPNSTMHPQNHNVVFENNSKSKPNAKCKVNRTYILFRCGLRSGGGGRGERSRPGKFGFGLCNQLSCSKSKKGIKENIKPIAVPLLLKTLSLVPVWGHSYLAGQSL